ncbi:flavin monoamine oxidase family protein [Winogradskyella sp.]
MKIKGFRSLKHIILPVVSLFIVSCTGYEFGANAFHKLPEETALDKIYNYSGKIIIIGAGASGLASAKILEENNIDYQIIEATDRYGGRLKKIEGFADFPMDIGAEWIHNKPEILNKLKGVKGKEIKEELISYRLESSSLWDGSNLSKVPKKELDEYFEGFTEYKFKNSTWYDFVADNFAKKVEHKIKYNSPVIAINYSKEQIEITTKNGEKIIGDKVLVTVPIGVLKSKMIEFIPKLDSKKINAIESIKYFTGFKLALKFSNKFYPNVISCETEEGDKEFYDYSFKKDSKYNILGLLSTGSSAEEYYKLGSKEAIVKNVISELDRMFDGAASKFYTGDFVFQDWGNHEFTKGTWSTSFFDKSSITELNRPIDKKVYFAGGANDLYNQGGVPGAIMSGYYTIDKLLSESK